MSTSTVTPPFESRHPRLARIATWPLVCLVVSVTFLGTVYSLGKFGQRVPAKQPPSPNRSIALSASANPPILAK